MRRLYYAKLRKVATNSCKNGAHFCTRERDFFHQKSASLCFVIFRRRCKFFGEKTHVPMSQKIFCDIWVKITNMPTKIKFVANALNSY